LSYVLPDNEFRAWSLDIFTALLAYDVLRVLIWFDHMGLRVATLVNLSFVGGDALDEMSARFVGKEQTSRAIPVGIRRFGTWAPLLLPFYIPRGAEWDKASSAAEQLNQTRPPVMIISCRRLFGLRWRRRNRTCFVFIDETSANPKAPDRGHYRRWRHAGARPLKLTNGLITAVSGLRDGQAIVLKALRAATANRSHQTS
jgi:cyclic beta-1,2-glucan synthetase